MLSTRKFAMLGFALLLAMTAVGCDEDRPRPDVDRTLGGPGLQSRDLREMTDRMAPDLLTIPEIVQNPNRVTIVVKGVQNNQEGNQGRNLDIYTDRLAGLLNSSSARDRIAFIEENATLRSLQAQELGNPDPFGEAGRTSAPADPKIQPQFALMGKFDSMRDSKTTYFLCQFKLTDLQTGRIVWEGQYDTRTWNHS